MLKENFSPVEEKTQKLFPTFFKELPTELTNNLIKSKEWLIETKQTVPLTPNQEVNKLIILLGKNLESSDQNTQKQAQRVLYYLEQEASDLVKGDKSAFYNLNTSEIENLTDNIGILKQKSNSESPSSFPPYFSSIPNQELINSLDKNAWSLSPDGQTKLNPNTELRKIIGLIGRNLNHENPQIQTQAANLLAIFKDEIANSLRTKIDPSYSIPRYFDKANLENLQDGSTDLKKLWEKKGQEIFRQQLPPEQTKEKTIKYPKLQEQYERETEKMNILHSQIIEQNTILHNHLEKNWPSFSKNLQDKINESLTYINHLQTLFPDDTQYKNAEKSLLVINKLIEKTKEDFFKNQRENILNKTNINKSFSLFPSEFDPSTLNSLDEQQAQEELNKVIENIKDNLTSYKYNTRDLVTGENKIFEKQILPIIDGIFNGLEYTENPKIKKIYQNLFSSVNQQLSDSFNIQYISVIQGEKLNDYTMEPVGLETEKQGIKDTISELSRPGYLFDKRLSIEPNKDHSNNVLRPAQVYVYQ